MLSVNGILAHPGLVVLLEDLTGLGAGRVLLPELDAGRPEVHHELRHSPDRHPRDDRLRQLQSRVLEARQAELNAELIARKEDGLSLSC